MPTAVAAYSGRGIDSTIHRRTPTAVSSRNSTPDRNTAPSAVCHSTPMPFTTPYVKYAFSPIPGAIAIGYRATAPIRILAKPAEIQVAAVTAAAGIPASARIDGFTKMM